MTDSLVHPSDDDLVLFFYGDLPDADRAAFAGHIGACEPCRARLNALTRTLHLAATMRAPDPGPDFEDRVWARLRPQLPHPVWSMRHAVGVAAWAASVAAIVGATWIGARQMPAVPPARPVAIAATPETSVQERVLLTAVDSHLTQAEVLFVELLNTPPDAPEAFAYARDTADDLVSSGRLYRATARATGDTPVAAMLDDLEAVLVEVARGPEEPRAQDVIALQDRIQADDLLFKVRAVAHDIRNRQSRVSSGEGDL